MNGIIFQLKQEILNQYFGKIDQMLKKKSLFSIYDPLDLNSLPSLDFSYLLCCHLYTPQRLELFDNLEKG